MNFARRSVLSAITVLAASRSTAVLAAKTTSPLKDLQGAVDKAIQADGVLRLPAGMFKISALKIGGGLRLEGVPGHTVLMSAEGAPVLLIENAANVSVSGIRFAGPVDQAETALVIARGAKALTIDACEFVQSSGSGLRLEGCSGRVTGNRFADIGEAGVFARDSQGLEISANHLHDIGNNGIQVWRTTPGEDATVVSNNRIERVAAKAGGNGQNGNGINVYKAGNVMVSGNRVSDCAFSAIRNNAGANCQIAGNSVSRTGEVAIYCEFGFEGAVVSGNLIEDVAFGISITNFNEGGRLAVCANNVVRNVKGGGSLAYTSAVGIAAEADTLVSGNVIENAADTGIALGWGEYCRDLSATGNIVRGCGRGIVFSVSSGAGAVMITGNRISGSRSGAIVGMDHKTPVTGDLGGAGAESPAQGLIASNLVST